jgi:hypothetical protein
MKRILILALSLALLSLPAIADDCVEVDIETDAELEVGVMYYFYAELTNCGDAGMVGISLSLEFGEYYFEFPGDIQFYMGAGETISRSVPFIIPPVIPSGNVTLCVTASKGDATSTDCLYMTINNPGDMPNPKDINDPRHQRIETSPQSTTLR